MNNLPKSLNTVTVLVAVARPYWLLSGDVDNAVRSALDVLGYADSPDTYELAAKARIILAKSVQP